MRERSSTAGDRFNHAAFRDSAAGTAVYRLQKLVAKRLQLVNFLLNHREVVAGHGIDFLARPLGQVLQRQQLPDGVNLEPELPGATDEDETANLGGTERTTSARTGWVKEPDLLIVPNSRDLDPAFPSGLSNGRRHQIACSSRD